MVDTNGEEISHKQQNQNYVVKDNDEIEKRDRKDKHAFEIILKRKREEKDTNWNPIS